NSLAAVTSTLYSSLLISFHDTSPTDYPLLHSFPTRRSSDLSSPCTTSRAPSTRSSRCIGAIRFRHYPPAALRHVRRPARRDVGRDRKSTRLNSSHVSISYAVFCLNKKKNS